MKEIVNYEMSILDTGFGISFNCNGKEIGVLDYETTIETILTPQWVIDEINRVIEERLRGEYGG